MEIEEKIEEFVREYRIYAEVRKHTHKTRVPLQLKELLSELVEAGVGYKRLAGLSGASTASLWGWNSENIKPSAPAMSEEKQKNFVELKAKKVVDGSSELRITGPGGFELVGLSAEEAVAVFRSLSAGS